MRYGLITPVLIINPRIHNAWELDGDVDDVVAIAGAADRLGFHFLTCSEHVAVPKTVQQTRGTRYWDPAVTLGFLAAHTDQVRLATYCLVLPYHHPLQIAKRYGTLDRLSGGRLVLGVGVGTLTEEFALLGMSMEGRGERADDALRALRASLGRAEPEYHGTHYEYEGLVVDPAAVQGRVPIWVGGQSRRSLRRAVELADGWAPFRFTREQVAAELARARDTEAWATRAAPLDVVLAVEPALDPGGDPGGTTDELARYEEAGATMLALRLQHRSRGHCLEQLEAFAEVAGRI